jgi:hypothetical protein
MSDRYRMQEFVAMLGVDHATALAWLEAAGIDPKQDPFDARRHTINHEDAERVAATHARILRPLPDNMPKTLPLAWARIVDLEMKRAELEAQIAQLKATQPRYERHTTPIPPEMRYDSHEVGADISGDIGNLPRRRPSTVKRSGQKKGASKDTLPATWQSVEDVAQEHGLPFSTIKRHIQKAAEVGEYYCHIAEDDDHRWKRGTGKITYAIDPEQLQGFLEREPPRQYCQRSGCPCHTMTIL